MLRRSHQLTRFSPALAGKGKLHCRDQIVAQPIVMSSDVETSRCLTNGTVARPLDFAPHDGAALPSHFEAFAQIKLPTDRIVDEEILGAFALDAPIENQIGTVYDGQSLAHIVIGDHDGQPRFA